MAELFGCSTDNISLHLKNIFLDGELDKDAVTEKFSATASDGKNYLNEKQIRQLERAVVGYFDYIEDLIERENTFTMEEFASSINEFLAFRRYDILPDKGRISAQEAKIKAENEYDIFNKTQKIISDFDKEVKRMLEKGDEMDE